MNRIRKGYVDTQDGQAHYRQAGHNAAPRLLLLHQTASSSVMFEAIMERLSDDFFMFAPDTPGYGGTFFPPSMATIEYYGQIMHQALAAFGWGNCFVFGHHTGASIAAQMEQMRPGTARKMLLSGPPYLTEEQKARFRAVIQPIVAQEDGAHTIGLWQRLRAKDPGAKLALTQREFVLNMLAGERYHETYHAVFTHDFNAQLAAIACPVLVMAGDADTLRDALEPAYAALQHGEIRYLSGNTYICDQSPETVAGIIREYFV